VSHAAIVTGALLAAFIFYLAANGRLPVYAAILLGKASPAPPGGMGRPGTPGDAATTGGPLSPALPTNPVQPPGSLIPPNFPYYQTVPAH
jgi:hypothetical protein